MRIIIIIYFINMFEHIYYFIFTWVLPTLDIIVKMSNKILLFLFYLLYFFTFYYVYRYIDFKLIRFPNYFIIIINYL